MTPPSARKRWLDLLLIFAIVYLGTQMGMRFLFPEQFGPPRPQGIVLIEPLDATVKDGHHPVLVVRNFTDADIEIPSRCPAPPVEIFYSAQGTPDTSGDGKFPQDIAVPCLRTPNVPSGGEQQIDLGPWKYSGFGAVGNYTVLLEIAPQPALATGAILTTSFELHEAGWMTQTFRAFVTKPLLNLLVLIATLTPGYNLGIAIIVLTLIVKLLLFIPTQHGLEGQRKLQALQPKIEELRKRCGTDAQKINQETMKLWKEHKVNPFQSCLPILVQFPVLIGLFYVIRDGSHLGLSEHLLYAPYKELPWTFGVHFLGLNLLEPNMYILPPLLVILQFVQMKLSFAMAKKKKEAKEGKEDKTKEKKAPLSQQEIQQKVMLYGLPFMIGFFAIQFPSAVSLYWGVSTVFAIGQQLVVNRRAR
jgi:YidC/Oxa1 family membrane protein insertase